MSKMAEKMKQSCNRVQQECAAKMQQVTSKIGSAHWKEEKSVTEKSVGIKANRANCCAGNDSVGIEADDNSGNWSKEQQRPRMRRNSDGWCGHTWCYWDECLKE